MAPDLLAQLAGALGDRYQVERELGQGGMAVVFLGEDLKHHRRVAIKVVRPELAAVLGGDRFLREIAITATLQHAHILPLFDSGTAGELVYYVMPFVEGESLRQRLERDGPLPLDTALQVARDVGSALQYAHDHHVVHRDIKPDNIMLSGGHAIVADFGIARAVHAANPELTRTGMVVGSPLYMSPEQARGEELDGRTDQYGLACVLFEMLAGEPPFPAQSAMAAIARHSIDPAPRLREVRPNAPPAVESAIRRALEKSPADRFPSMSAFQDALASSGTQSSLPLRGRARRAVPRLAAGLAAVLVLGAAAWRLAFRSAPAGAGPASVTTLAVLPFEDLSANADSSYLGAGMTEGLAADLAQVRSLRVLSASSVAMDAQANPAPADRAGRLGVAAMVSGSIRRTGDSVVVRVRLTRTADRRELFTQQYRGRLGALPDLQREMTLALVQSIGTALGGAERRRLTARREVDRHAYEAWLHGRFYLEHEDLEQARREFVEASRIEPAWAPPLVGLANYYTTLPFNSDVSPAAVMPRARAALNLALSLDSSLAEAHAAAAYLRAYFEWDWRAAEQEFRRAVELRPSYGDAYFSYSRFLASRRRLDEAVAQLEKAVELDPLSTELQANRALLDYFAGRYDSARGLLEVMRRSDSSDVMVTWALALVAEQQGRAGEAVALLEPVTGSSLNRRASLGHMQAVAGQTAKALGVLQWMRGEATRRFVPSYYFALIQAGLGRREEALRSLERAYEERSTVLAYLLIDPRLAPLRSDPRFQALARQLGGE